ncbi:hypothetical protein KC19_VG072500 [Ceratodon purpureus]|uniref:Cilia- and flagella-associated protein 58 central coiled coil domain-containing protein n=1 Tax=Ceratodon purpureus TaxID=3225 RepID=A0A8T0HNG2_CERPU|nr:hypothetical protein KC19_VG072500 [Ceratodon purpureus]
MQMMGKLHDLKHQHDKHANAIKERDRTLILLKQREDLVNKLQSQLPQYEQERDAVQRELVTAAAVFADWEVKLVVVRNEVKAISKLFRVTDEKGKELIRAVREHMKKVKELEEKIQELADLDKKNTQRVLELTNVKARLGRTAAAKYSLWKETVAKTEFVRAVKENFDKRLVEILKECDEAVALNGIMRGQRNKFDNLVKASAITIPETKDKIKMLAKEVEQWEGEVLYREHILCKMRRNNQANLRERILIKDETAKCISLLKEKKVIAEELGTEIHKLQDKISKIERDMIRARKIYELAVKDRNKVGIMLIDRNDELCILFEKNNVQVELLNNSEVELMKRKDEITMLKRECNLIHKSIIMEKRMAPDPTSVYEELSKLKEQMTQASTMVAQLSELVEKPENLNRWRVLPGRDYNFQELTQKARGIEEFLSAKEDQAYEKNLILEEVTVLANDLMRRVALARPESKKIGVKFNAFVRQLTLVRRQIMATVSELSLVQAIAIGTKQERISAQYNIDDAHRRLDKGQVERALRGQYYISH